jgi:hypothetical protein
VGKYWKSFEKYFGFLAGFQKILDDKLWKIKNTTLMKPKRKIMIINKVFLLDMEEI